MKIDRTSTDTLSIEMTQAQLELLTNVIEDRGNYAFTADQSGVEESQLCDTFMHQAIRHLAVQY